MLHHTNMLLILLFCAGLTGCAGQPDLSARIAATPGSEETTITMETKSDDVIIAIQDPAGIGQADFTYAGGDFPTQVVFRFYLHGLEKVQLVYGDTQVEASVASQPGNPISQRLAPDGEALEAGSPYWMNIEIVPQDGAEPSVPLQSGYIQVAPPPEFYKAQPESWSLSWVDFYR